MTKDATKELIEYQSQERKLLSGLNNILIDSDLSKLDLRTFPGKHNIHDVLVDNYEIIVSRTPVYTYSNTFARIFCWGRWVFEPGLYERYQLRIFENPHNMRLYDIGCYFGRRNINYVPIIECGTMASDRGYYLCNRREVDEEVDYEKMFYKQNAHLFEPTKNLYNILDSEYKRRVFSLKKYPLPEIKDASDMKALQLRMFDRFRDKLR